jgi:hypothetical protein
VCRLDSDGTRSVPTTFKTHSYEQPSRVVGRLLEPPDRADPSNGAMRSSSLQHQLDELFRQSQSLRDEGRYAESVRALLDAAELMNRYTDDQPSPPGVLPG